MPRQSKEVIQVKIEQATMKLFEIQGYSNISMDEIAKKAEISKRTLYKYYPSKLTLFISIFEQYLQQLITNQITADYSSLNFSETVLAIFTSLYEFTDRNRSFMNLFWTLNNDIVEGEVPEKLLIHVLLLNNQIIENAARFLEKKESTGIFKNTPPILIAQTLSSMNKGIFMQSEKESGLGINDVTKEDLFKTYYKILAHCTQE